MVEYTLSLALLEEFGDPHTVRQLDAIAVAEGWCCLDVRAGAARRGRLASVSRSGRETPAFAFLRPNAEVWVAPDETLAVRPM